MNLFSSWIVSNSNTQRLNPKFSEVIQIVQSLIVVCPLCQEPLWCSAVLKMMHWLSGVVLRRFCSSLTWRYDTSPNVEALLFASASISLGRRRHRLSCCAVWWLSDCALENPGVHRRSVSQEMPAMIDRCSLARGSCKKLLGVFGDLMVPCF